MDKNVYSWFVMDEGCVKGEVIFLVLLCYINWNRVLIVVGY